MELRHSLRLRIFLLASLALLSLPRGSVAGPVVEKLGVVKDTVGAVGLEVLAAWQKFAAFYKIARSPGGHKFEQFFMVAKEYDQPITMFLPLKGVSKFCAQKQLTAASRKFVRQYHIANGKLLFKDLQAMMRYETLDTVTGQVITKTSSNKWPVVVLLGAEGPKSVIVKRNWYVGENLVIHIVSNVIKPAV
eukprot:TRINITY_DN27867_c0_g1_i1.p1 TRINITY_DN27867_c0_g1~~TRINITY_DN27867_c0_g1_i1.p1  ORF type:complete len:191 (+),score=7.01 TRINITY_DN27867_c0_g1_i1:248-820(+)